MITIKFEPQECAIKMGVASQTAETVKLLADEVAPAKIKPPHHQSRSE